MLSIIIAIFLLGFGFFLRQTKDPRFISSKKMSWVFILCGALALILKIVNYTLLGKL